MKRGNKQVVFLTGIFPDEIREEIITKSKSNIQFAADALQRSLIKGLTYHYSDLKVFNFPFIGGFPKLNKMLFVKSFNFGQNEKYTGINVGYTNLMGYKNFEIYSKTKKLLKEWAATNKEEKVVVIYHAYIPFIKAALEVKSKYPQVKVCLIVPDLPQFMNKPKDWLYKWTVQKSISKLEGYYSSIDYFVLLSKYMAEKLPIQNHQWTVVEGIFNNADLLQEVPKPTNTKTIFYAGTLAKRYGIMNLVEAFKTIKNAEYRLVICGDGDAKEEIVAAATEDKRIDYKGSLDRKEVLKLQRQSSLLVNPRTAEGEFTKFSFPSKTMEYLASGVPVLLYKLPGIPDEYYNYCFTLEDTLISSLANRIKEILSCDPSSLKEKGQKARQFILDKKNPKEQC